MAGMTRQLTAEEAADLWNSLRGYFVNAEKAIIEIIELRAWEPLGFETFAEAWESKMQGVKLATDFATATAVYLMYDEGLTRDEIAETLGHGSGIGHSQVDALIEDKELGVPPEAATPRRRRRRPNAAGDNLTPVDPHWRRLPGRARRVHLEFTTLEYEAFTKIAKSLDTTVQEIAAEAVRQRFRELA